MTSRASDEGFLKSDARKFVELCHGEDDPATEFKLLFDRGASILREQNPLAIIRPEVYIPSLGAMLPEVFFTDGQVDCFDVVAVGVRPLILSYAFKNSADGGLDIKSPAPLVFAGASILEDTEFPNFDLSNVSVDEALEVVFENFQETCEIVGTELKLPEVTGPVEEAADSGP